MLLGLSILRFRRHFSARVTFWGRGTIRIINECINYGIPAPIFNYDFASFSIEMQQAAQTIKKLTTEILLTENQQAIIALLREDGRITRASLSQKLGISEKSVSSNIKTLKELGLVIRVGSKKEGNWKVTIG